MSPMHAQLQSIDCVGEVRAHAASRARSSVAQSRERAPRRRRSRAQSVDSDLPLLLPTHLDALFAHLPLMTSDVIDQFPLPPS